MFSVGNIQNQDRLIGLLLFLAYYYNGLAALRSGDRHI